MSVTSTSRLLSRIAALLRAVLARLTNASQAFVRSWARGPYQSTIAVTAAVVPMMALPLFATAAAFDWLTPTRGGGHDAVELLIAGAAVSAFGAGAMRLCRPERALTVRQLLTALVAAALSAVAVTMIAHLATGAVGWHQLDVAFAEAVATVSGTNASALDPASLTVGLTAFRAIGQWVTAAAAIVVLVRVLPHLGVGGLDADGGVATRSARRLAPSRAGTISRLLALYVGATVLCGIAYALARMSLSDAFIHALTTLSTGGFSPYAESIGHFNSPTIEWVAIVGMFTGGVSLPLMFLAARRVDPLRLLRSREFNFYGAAVGFCALCVVLWSTTPVTGDAIRHALFATVSAASTTGFLTSDITAFPSGGQVLLIGLMLVGGMSASTSGGFKAVRLMALVSYIGRELRRALHPTMVAPVRLGRSTVSEGTVSRIAGELLLSGLLAVPIVIVLAASGLDLVGAWSFVVSATSNAGPALGEAGPTGHLAELGVVGHLVSGALMLAGRVSVTAALVALTVAAYPMVSAGRYHVRARRPARAPEHQRDGQR